MAFTRDEFPRERIEHLRDLADEYDLPLRTVIFLADMLGPNEDYDGLVNACEDYSLGW